MPRHEKLAQEAAARGEGSAAYTAAAQRHAKAAWFFLIISVGFWYFWGWRWALIIIAIAAFTAFQSITATKTAAKLKSQEGDSETGADQGK